MTEADSHKKDMKYEKLSLSNLEALEKHQLIETIQTLYDLLEQKTEASDISHLKESEEKCRQQLVEVTKRETMLLKTLTEKERELADLASQIDELKQYQLPSNNQLRTMLLDPTVNVVISRLKKEMDSTKQKLEETQSELSAWKFTQDSQTGKQLMARCRTLLKENEELGKQISQGRIAKLEGEIALERKLVEEMKAAQKETDEFVIELDEVTEGLQATVYLLQEQLKEAKNNQKGRIDVDDYSADATRSLTVSNVKHYDEDSNATDYEENDLYSGQDLRNGYIDNPERGLEMDSSVTSDVKLFKSVTNGHPENIETG